MCEISTYPWRICMCSLGFIQTEVFVVDCEFQEQSMCFFWNWFEQPQKEFSRSAIWFRLVNFCWLVQYAGWFGTALLMFPTLPNAFTLKVVLWNQLSHTAPSLVWRAACSVYAICWLFLLLFLDILPWRHHCDFHMCCRLLFVFGFWGNQTLSLSWCKLRIRIGLHMLVKVFFPRWCRSAPTPLSALHNLISWHQRLSGTPSYRPMLQHDRNFEEQKVILHKELDHWVAHTILWNICMML